MTGSEEGASTRFSADEIHKNILTAAEDEMERPASELLLSGLAAGLGIGFSFLASALVGAHMGEEHQAIASAIAYPIGFIYVVLARHQLFTENTLEPVIPLLERRSMHALKSLARIWAIVLLTNLIGAAIFALAVAKTPSVTEFLHPRLLKVAREATEEGALVVFIKAIWAGWLVALMAWLLASSEETIAQIALIWLTTAPIAGLGFKHSIAGATEGFYRVLLGDMSLGSMFTSFELPAIAGNIIGGVVLVAFVNHGQTGSGKADEKSEAPDEEFDE